MQIHCMRYLRSMDMVFHIQHGLFQIALLHSELLSDSRQSYNYLLVLIGHSYNYCWLRCKRITGHDKARTRD